MLALPISLYVDIPLDPISMTEALPFLVCTVGFDKPLRLARAVFNHPHLTTPVKDGKWRGQMKPAGELILEAFDRVGNVILRDYALEVAVLVIGANSKVGGLKEFCALAATCLTVDCILLGTFYVSILSIMVEVRIHLSRDSPNLVYAIVVSLDPDSDLFIVLLRHILNADTFIVVVSIGTTYPTISSSKDGPLSY
jgi:hypothetical protein